MTEARPPLDLDTLAPRSLVQWLRDEHKGGCIEAADYIDALIAEVRSLREQVDELTEQVAADNLMLEGDREGLRIFKERAEKAEARLNAASKDDLAERLDGLATYVYKQGDDVTLLRAAADRIRIDAARIAKYETLEKAATEFVATHFEAGDALSCRPRPASDERATSGVLREAVARMEEKE